MAGGASHFQEAEKLNYIDNASETVWHRQVYVDSEWVSIVFYWYTEHLERMIYYDKNAKYTTW